MNGFAIWTAAVSLLTGGLYALDKSRAISRGRRIPERVLLWVARLGGGLGCWLGMMLFRHKTKHVRFKVLVPLWTVLWIVALVLLVRLG